MELHCEIGSMALRDFAVYETFVRRKRWRSPALFAGIFGVSAAICFLLHERSGAILLGCVLLLIGLGVPGVYIGTYLHSLRVQSKKLAGRLLAYTVRLDETGVTMVKGEKEERWPWPEIKRAARRPSFIAVYPGEQAFLLGGAEIDRDGVWACLQAHLPPENLST